jgi:hypothetical protein
MLEKIESLVLAKHGIQRLTNAKQAEPPAPAGGNHKGREPATPAAEAATAVEAPPAMARHGPGPGASMASGLCQ